MPKPDPKSRTLARGKPRYRRVVAGPKAWQALRSAKLGPCRICGDPGSNGQVHARIHLHHVVPRDAPWFGDDVADNLVPLCPADHESVTNGHPITRRILCATLTDAEYGYAVRRGGEGFFERAYGVEYVRP